MEKISLKKARIALGKTGEKMTDEEIETTMASFEYLVEGWMDMYFKEVDSGSTHKQIMKKYGLKDEKEKNL